jgi:hypothetical protein
MMQQICANGPLHIPEECVILAEYIYRNWYCLFSSVLHFNLLSMITANQLLLSISCFKCVVLLLDIFNNYPRLRSTKTPTGRLHGCSGFRFICCVVKSEWSFMASWSATHLKQGIWSNSWLGVIVKSRFLHNILIL